MTGLNRPFYSKARINQLSQLHGYKVLDQLVIADYDQDWSGLYQQLCQSKKSHYLPEDKYIVHHQDTEYFLGDTGFAIENFNRVVRSLDIDPCRFVIFTNHRGSRHRWLSYCDHEQNQYTVIETPWTELLCYDQPRITPWRGLQHHFCCIMGAGRTHRDKLSHWIKERDLQVKNLTVYHRNQPPGADRTPANTGHSDHNHYLTTAPFTRINEEWSNHSRWQSSTDVLQDARVVPYDQAERFHSPWYEHTLFDLVAETVFNYPHAYISEKTVRPIVGGRPFVAVAAPNTLAWLQEMGFETFSRWWDESYDQEPDPDARLSLIFDTVMDICSWSPARCERTLQEMLPVLEHNQHIYKGLAF